MLRELLFDLFERASQYWRDIPTPYIHAIVFLSLTISLNAILKESKSPVCPSVHVTKLPLAGLWGTLKSTIRFGTFLKEGYKRYLVKGIPCKMPDMVYGSTSTLVLLPTSALKWMLKQPDSVLDHHGESQQGVQEMRHLSWQAKTAFEHPVHGASTHGWMQRWIGAQFDASKDESMADICESLDQCWGNDMETWREVNLLESLMPVFHQYTWKLIVGKPLDKNRDLWQYGYLVSVLSIPASLLLHLFPVRFRSTAARILGLPSRYVFRRLERIIMPLIKQRISHFASRSDRHLGDYISWAVRNDAQQRGIDDDTPRRVMSLVVSLTKLMNTSPSIVTHGFNELLHSPQKGAYEEKLRAEIQRALHEEGGHWTKSMLSKLHGLDSMLREILRLHPIAAVAPVQTAVADIEIPLANGENRVLRIRKGTRVGIAAHNIHMDETYYKNPKAFEPWRFMSSRSRDFLEGAGLQQPDEDEHKDADKASSSASHNNKKQQALLSPSNMWFGWGMGKGSCPGRWIAHDTLKLIFSAILLRYEIRAVNSPSPARMLAQSRKDPSRFGPFLPPANTKVLIRRRRYAEE